MSHAIGVITLQIFMWLAVLLTVLLLIPAVWQVSKTRNTTSLSKWMYIFYPICSISWIAYAILMIFENVPIYEIIGIAVSEGISMVLALYILIVKLLNLRTAKSLHLTEGEWYRQYTHKKEIKKHLKSLGVHSLKDIAKYNEQQDHLHKVLDLLFEAYPDVVDNRILKFKIFRKTLKRHITNNAKRLEHFKNIASNADLASIIRLVYLDIWEKKL